nr:PREDICTED: F-box/FBD/LRR-repeat protein At1g13570-like [Daucus carota subsp. sativus]
MARSKGKKVRYNKEHILSEPPSTDIISELPGHLRETIVGFLPLEDAVRTSILSRKWRYCWTMIPNLIFEDTFVDRIMDKLFEYDDPELKAFKLVSVINKILLLHNGPIVKFSCNFDEGFRDSRIFHDYMDQWIPLLLRKGTKQLVLEHKETQTKRSNVDHVLGSLSNIEKFSVAMEFMQYLAAGRRLKTLSKPLLCLKTLNISDIYLNKLSEVSCLICLIRSAPNLCQLNISAKYVAKGDFKKYQMKDFEECTMDHLEIVTFSYFEGFRAEMKLVKFLLACSPLLKKMSIHSHEDLEKDVALMMFKEILQYPTASSRVQIQHTTPAEIDV